MNLPLAKMDPADVRTAVLLLIGLAIGFWLLFLPGTIAKRRNHPNATAIKVCGILGGLLSVGLLWIIALIWAYTNPNPSHVTVSDSVSSGRTRARPLVDEDCKACPFCAEIIKAAAIVCRHCGRDLEVKGSLEIASDPAFDRMVEEEISQSGQPTRWRIHGIKEGKHVSGTVTADTSEAARSVAARHFETITSVEPA